MARLTWARLLTRGTLAVMMALSCGLALGQTPSAAQMEAFQNLTPEQQQAILEQMGGSGQTGTVRRDRDVTAPETVRPRTPGDKDEAADADQEEVPAELGMPGMTAKLPREPRIRASDTVLIEAKLRPAAPLVENERSTEKKKERSKEETARLQAMLDRVLRGNPYKLDVSGVLRLPGVAPIPLAGLTEKQASARLNRDPALAAFEAKLTLLPLEKLDVEALRPFGYDLFAGVPSTYAPVSDIPLPAEYVVGPGDRFEVQLIGNTKSRQSLVVNRDGRIMFPELGPIAVAGLKFDAAKARIEARVSEQMIGTQAVVAMSDLRSIRIFVLGEAERPGSYTVSGLATITNALFASGGVKKIGSLRNIQLKRGGTLVTRLDLYDLLLNGDTSNDVRLLPGDVIFIPPVGETAGVAGAIRRPAIYELLGESRASDLLYLGGGLMPDADPKLATIDRINEGRERVVLNVDLSSAQARGTDLRSGDVLRIPAARPTLANSVQLKGHVQRPSSFQFRRGMRLTDVIPSVDDLKPGADARYVMIRREQPGSQRISVISADLEEAWRARTTDSNPLLEPRDQIFVFDAESGRSQYLDPVLQELKLQSSSAQPSQIVRVSGRVRAEGEFPLEPGMTVSDLVRAGGGLDEQAFGGEAELARYEVLDGQTRRTEVIKVDLNRALAGDPAADLLLAPFDLLVVKQVSEWTQQEAVTVEGEVKFPGVYPIKRGETMRSLIARAGGLTSMAYPQGSLFTREYLKEREREQIRVLTDRMRQDLSSLALQSAQSGAQMATQASETLNIGQSLLKDLQAAEPVGRLVIDLDTVLAAQPDRVSDLVLRDGDHLRIPKMPQEVTVIGEVQNATSHLYMPNLTRDDYLSMSGGVTRRADGKRIYVVRASGSVDGGSGSRWFRSSSNMRPGDTIVVPLDAERMRPLPLWTAVSTILYNIAISVAAVNSF
ncbi:MAG: SLBB domain-containing protein [Steroidobacteraceae bacterium]|nr:SLBB domain-containing protein [Steroidobacteraceae bacterium]MBP7013276.1 SLBB domain-containing protein [Steroidobacteraceae bacterium]